jgi:transposase
LRDRLGEHAGPEKGELTGPNPVDRGKYGSKIHLITERSGLPLSVGISGANLHDSQALVPLVKGIPPVRSRRGPRRRKPGKLHADKGYDYAHLRRWLSRRGIRHRIARKGVETSQRLGSHRWTIERTMAWLTGCRRLHRRYERKAVHFLAFTSIACTLILLPQTHKLRWPVRSEVGQLRACAADTCPGARPRGCTAVCC